MASRMQGPFKDRSRRWEPQPVCLRQRLPPAGGRCRIATKRGTQGGEAGAALRFFKAPPRGCGKIGKRNPSGGALLYKFWLARGWIRRGMSNKRTPVPCSGCPTPQHAASIAMFKKSADRNGISAICRLRMLLVHEKRKRLSMAGKNKKRDAPVVKRCVPFLFSFVHSAVPEPCVPRSGCRANQKLHRARKRKREYGMEESEPLAEGSAALVRFG